MPIDPLTIIGEILGEPAGSMRNPVNAEYRCPYINSTCLKRSQKIQGPYPVCSIFTGRRTPDLIAVCPKRFYAADLVHDVIKHCWMGAQPQNPQVAYEVSMKGFGNVDFVIADVDQETNRVRSFISVELQAVDISGSVESAYQATLNSQTLESWPSYGINWGNVRKRYISQLIAKGFFHHHWGSRMVAVLQTSLYTQFRKYIEFDELPATGNSNIIFMLYKFEPIEGSENCAQQIVLDRVVGTSHSSLMTGSLYRATPPREQFCERILAGLARQ